MEVGFWILVWILILSFGLGFITILIYLILDFYLNMSERRRCNKKSRRSDEE